ncbi:MAG: hypothetical protein J6D09_00420, partial [Clostridia bacterium]|nr:hypothetical protein [Clostridia bacterium]
ASVGRGLAPAVTKGIEYTKYGQIAEEQLLLLEKRYPYFVYSIPLVTAGASPRPTEASLKFLIRDNRHFRPSMHIVIKYAPAEL